MGDATFAYTAPAPRCRRLQPALCGRHRLHRVRPRPEGQPDELRDENGKQDALLYDALDRLETIRQVRAAPTTTDFAYDALSNVTEVTDAAAKTTDLLHDDRGHLVEMVSPDTGTTRFLYDARRQPRAQDRGRGGHGGLDAVQLRRARSPDRHRPPERPDWVFTYDTSTAANQKGRLAHVTNGVVTTQLEYTQRGDVAIERTIVDGLSYAVQYAYDAAGNRTQVQGPSGTQATTSYAGLRPSA